MKPVLRFREVWRKLNPLCEEDLDAMLAAVTGGWKVEHRADGTHSAISADTVTADRVTATTLTATAGYSGSVVVGDGAGGTLTLTYVGGILTGVS